MSEDAERVERPEGQEEPSDEPEAVGEGGAGAQEDGAGEAGAGAEEGGEEALGGERPDMALTHRDEDEEDELEPEGGDDDGDDGDDDFTPGAKKRLVKGGGKGRRLKKIAEGGEGSAKGKKRSRKRGEEGKEGKEARKRAKGKRAAATPEDAPPAGEGDGDFDPAGGGEDEEEEDGDEGVPEGEEGEGAPQGDEEDEEDDSHEAPQAVEEGSKSDFDAVLERLKKRKRQERAQSEVMEEVVGFLTRMDDAAVSDVEAHRKGKPAVSKVAMVKEMETTCRRVYLHEFLLDKGVLQSLAKWLAPLPSGALPNETVRGAVLRALRSFESDDVFKVSAVGPR